MIIKSNSFKTLIKTLAVILAVIIVMIPLAGCGGEEENVNQIANYGSYGADFATTFAQKYPYRSPGSEQENSASALIAAELQKLGYQIQIQEYYYSDNQGVRKSSQNIICQLEGRGFVKLDDEGNETAELIDDHWNLIGAHYDVVVTSDDYQFNSDSEQAKHSDAQDEAEDKDNSFSGGQAAEPVEPEGITAETETTAQDDFDSNPWQMGREIPVPIDYSTFDGINTNASGVAAVLTAAAEMLTDRPGYDIRFVFFRAGSDDFAGAKA
ncbi:MAG: hypothetical protein GX834_01425, partial [Clostridiaceae bacterium]|nr:hypothetical protein [Clostridiaceae bacterium]